jgi:hypothetical protein
MSPEREVEYEQLLAFLDFYLEHVKKPAVPVDGQPRPSLRAEAERISREYGRSKALEGTRQAVNDVVEELSGLGAEGVKLLDEVLRGAGILTLSEIRRRYSAAYRKILQRGKINTETEYYLVNGLVVDLSSNLTEDERRSLEALVFSYES